MALSKAEQEKIRNRWENRNNESSTGTLTLSDSVKAKIADRWSHRFDVDDSYINTFINDSSNFLNQLQTDYRKLDYKTGTAKSSQDYYQSLRNKENDIKTRAWKIQNYLKAHKADIDEETYTNLSDYLNTFSSDYMYTQGIFDYISLYSKFDTEEDYNFWETHSTLENRQQWYADQQKRIDELKYERENSEYDWTDYNQRAAAAKRATEIDEEIASIEAEMRLYERGGYNESGLHYGNKVVDDYQEVMNSANFARDSAYRAYDNPTRDELAKYDAMQDTSTWHTDANGVYRDAYGNELKVDASGNWVNPHAQGYEVTDRLGMFLKASEDELMDAAGTPVGMEGTWESIIKDGIDGNWEELTEGEIGIYYALRKNSQEAADKYLEDMKTELNHRATQAKEEQWAKGYDEANFLEKIALNLASVPAQLFSGVASTIENTANTLAGNDINPYSAAHGGMSFSQTVRSETAADLDETGFKIPLINFSLGDIYQSGMSILDSYAAIGIGGALGGALLATSAGSSEATRLYEQGASVGQIAVGSAAAGAAEMIFESLSIDRLIKIKDAKTVGQWIKNALIQGGIEATEEGFTEISNILTNAIVMKSESDWAKLVEDNGGDTWKAFLSEVQAVAHASFAGFLSGTGSASIPSGISYAESQSQFADYGGKIMNAGGIDALMDLANEVAGVSSDKAKNAITKLQEKVTSKTAKDSKAKSTVKAVGRLYDTVNTTITEQNKADIAAELKNSGISSKKANDIADALVALTKGRRLTSEQEQLLKDAKGNVDHALKKVTGDERSSFSERNTKMAIFDNAIAVGTMVKEHTEKAFTPEGKYTVSDTGEATALETEVDVDGKTITKDTGEVIDIKGVASIHVDPDTKKVVMLLDIGDGKTINAENVAYANKNDALIYESIANLGDNINAETANRLIAKYDGGDAMVFARGMAQAYSYGFYGIDRSELTGKHTLTAELTDEQRNFAYGLGEQYRPTKDLADKAQAQKNLAKSGKTPSEKGVYYRDKDGNATDISTYLKESGIKLNDTQKTGIEAMRKLSAAIGVRFNVFESWVENGKRYYLDENGVKTEGSPNGFYDTTTGEIYIDLRAGNDYQGTILFTVAHELTHFMRQWSPEHFTKIANIVFKHGGMKGNVSELIALKQAKAKKKGKPISYDTAMEEVVADGMETILKDGKVVEFMSEVKQKDRVAWEKIKGWFKNLAKFLRKMVVAYRGQSAQTVEGAKVADFAENLLRQIEQIWAEGAVAAGENYQTALENVVDANAEAVSTDEIITDGAVVTDGEGTKFSIKSMKHDIAEGQMFEDLKKYCGWTQSKVNELRNNLNDLVEYMNPHRDILDMNESYGREGRRFSPYKPNSDPLYKISMDFSTLCSKRLLTQYVIENLQLRENRPMSPEEQMAIRDMLNEYRKVEKGLQVACAMCYVEAARLKSPKQIQRWLDDPAPHLRNYFALKNTEFNAFVKEKQADFKEYIGYARNTPKKDMKQADVTELNKIGPKLRSQYKLSAEEQAIIDKALTLPNSTYLTAGNLADLSETDPIIYAAYTSFVRTATRSKSLETDEPYYYGDSRRDNGNGIIVSDSFIEAVNRENGMRFSSWSDWRIQHLLDYITAVIDNSVRGAAMHGYTKFGEEVRVLGKTGMMFNMSGVAGTQTGLTEDGSLSFSPTESIDVNEAIQLREEFPEHAGLQCIGVSDAHIIALLRSDIIDYVIPYHVSGLNAALRRMADIYGWADYTGTQHAAIDKSIKKEDAVDPEHWHEEPVYSEFFVGYDTGMSGIEAMRASAEKYKQMCKDRGLTPKFNQFANEANFWKLLIDRKMINQQTGDLIRQKAVTPTFDFDAIKGVVDRYVDNYDSGLEARALNHIVENWDSIPQRIKDLKKKGGTKAKKAKKAVDTLANETLAAQPVDTSKLSMRTSIEETKDLLAYHNITQQLLLDVLNRKGLLMPSLAVTNKGMTDFGEISLLFDKSTIDPNANSNNKLYGADAWTPTQTKLKKNAKFDTDKTVRAVNSIKNRIGSKFVSALFDVSPKQFKNTIISADGSIYDAYAHDIGMQTAYALEHGIISKVPTNKDGTLDKEALQKQLAKELDTDNGWRQYKKWLNNISDTVITSYDNASNEDILNNMKSQPATAKAFKLSETGELVVPAVEYSSIDEARKNKNRLSENAAEATKAVADEFLSFAKKVGGNTKSVVDAINASFANRYSTADIVKSFNANGIKISSKTAGELQSLYKKAVELPTQYFEAKPGREVGLDEIKAVVMPADASYAELKGKLEDAGISVVEYTAGSNQSRVDALNSMDSLKFSDRNSDKSTLATNGTVKYSNGRQFFRDNVFPPYKTSHSDSHEVAERWARSKEGRKEKQRLLSHHGKWYVIEVVYGGVYGYQIVSELNAEEYDRRAKNYGKIGRYESPRGAFDKSASHIRGRASARGTGSSVDPAQSGYRGENPGLSGVDEQQVQRGEVPTGQASTDRSSGEDRGRRYDPPVKMRRLAELNARIEWLKKQIESDRVSKETKTEYRRELKSVRNEMDELMNGYFPSRTSKAKMSDRDNVPTFYSQMARVVDGMKQEKFGASSVVSMLRGRGVKAEEIRWSGIQAFLDGKKSVTKQELLDFINSSMLHIEEQERGGTKKYSPEQQKRLNELEYEINAAWDEMWELWQQEFGEDIPIEFLTSTFVERRAKKIITNANAEAGTEISEDSKRIIQLARLVDINNEEVENISYQAQTPETKWDQYKLDGGSNYRELVFTIPGATYTNMAMQGHWGVDAQGVLAHARIQDFDTADGKMLFIEEIQSDWHNQGHKEGYRKEGEKTESMLRAESKKAYEEFYTAVEKMLEDNADWEDDNAIYYAHPVVVAEMFDGNESHFEDLKFTDEQKETIRAMVAEESARQEALKTAPKQDMAPDAPFKENYHEFVLKRLLRMAAEEGYDSIGWTTAELQMERWNPERQTNEMFGIPSKNPNAVAFEEGYSIEYDQDIPKFLKKYGKQWGATVEKTGNDRNIELLRLGPSPNDVTLLVNDEAVMNFTWLDSGWYVRADGKPGVFENWSEIQEFADMEYPKTDSIWKMDITDSMKESVLTEGQALYQDRDTDSVSNRSLLANAFEGLVQNDAERNKIQEYKEKISLINEEERKLRELNDQIKELSFSKGPRDTKKIKSLRFDAAQAANRINTYDKQLLRLEASKPLQDVLNREKRRAYKKAEERGKEALAEYKAKVEAKQKETTEKWRESRKTAVAKARETAEKRDARAKLQKLVLDTVNWISYPAKTDVKCPDILKQPYADFLNGIDLSSKRLANGGDPTKNDLRLSNAMDSLATALDKIMTSQDPTQDVDKVLDTGYLDLPADFVMKLRDMTENIKSMMVEGDYVVNNMTAAEVRQLSQMIRTLNHAIKTMSNLYANLRFANVEALGFDTMEFMDALGEIEKTGNMKDFVQWDNALPYYAFKRFGKGGESVFEGLMDAQDKLAYLAQKIFNFRDKAWTGEEAKAWSEDTHTIKLPEGNELTLTTADAMSIYCLSRREQGLQHLLGGGTRVLGIQKGSQKAKDSRSLLTIKDIDAINSSLTDRQREVAEAIQEFMSTVCSEWGNEISMKRFLTKEFTEKFYFPIESNDENLPVKDPAAQQSDLFRLLNISATKPLTPGANNEVIIRNIFDVFTGHASDMARLNAYGLGLLDYMKWLNYREKTVTDEGQVKVRGVRKSMQQSYGNAAMSYVLNLVKDVNGRASDGGDPNFLMKMMRAAKTASVGSSLRVAALQLTSYPRAALVLSPKSLALGLSKMPNIKRAKKYCGIALWKSFGFYDTNISRSIEDQMKGVTDIKQKLIELSLKGAEWGDAITWGALWNACEYEVAQTTKNKVGSEEFYQEVGKKLREVVYKTQVVDSTLTRSQIMRSKRGMAQEAAAFMSEPTLSANILMDAGFEFGMEKRRTGSAKKAWQKTGSYIGKAVAVYSIGQLTAALLESLFDAWRDDEDEKFGKKYLDALVENLVLDIVPFNKLPIVSDVFEAALSMVGIGFYSSDKMSSTWLTQAVSAVDTWKDVFSGESSATVYNALYKTTRAVSSFYGVSVSGVMRAGVALWNNTAGAYDSTLKVRQYDLSNANLGAELYEAIISGNTRQADSLKAKFDDKASMHSAVRKALRENDPRIKEAAAAEFNGDPSERVRIAKLIIADGFDQDDVVMAINAELNDMKPDEPAGDPKAKGLYTAENFAREIANGDQAAAYEAKADIIATEQKNGKSEEEAVKKFISSAKTELKNLFKAGDLTEQQVIDTLITFCDMEEEDAVKYAGSVSYEIEHPELDGAVTYTEYQRWEADGKPNGVTIEMFVEVAGFRDDGTSNSVKSQDEVALYIASVTSDRRLRHALWCCFYKASTSPWK